MAREVVDLVWAQILRAAAQEFFAVPAYCFMRDHLHLFVEGLAVDSDLKRFMSAAKQFSGYYYSKQYGERLWQRYGFERVLRPDEPSVAVVRYILENPVRAGFVSRLDEYPFMGSSIYTIAELMDYVQSQSPSG